MILDRLFGTAQLEFDKCLYPQVLNAVSRLDIHFFHTEITDDRAKIKIPLMSLSRFMKGSGLSDCVTVSKGGLFPFLARYKKRWGIAAGAALFFALTVLSTRVIWCVDVSGNHEIGDEYIKSVLAKLGCRPGAFISDIDFDILHNRFLMESEGIGWISVNMNGTHANVEVRETKPGVPSHGDGGEDYCNLAASEDGQIERVAAIEGKPQVKIFDTVQKGQLLVSGILSRDEGGIRLESASGSVFAKVRRDFEVRVPLDGTEKAYTGRKSEKKTLTFFSFDVNLFTNSGIPYELYDTIETKENVYLFDAVELPICVRRIRYEEYAQKEAHISEDEARSAALKLYREKLCETLGSAELLSKTTESSFDGSTYTIKCSIYCLADIAAPVPFTVKENSGDAG